MSTEFPHKDYESDDRFLDSASLRLEKICKGIGMDPEKIKHILELGSGRGRNTDALLTVFGQAQVYAIDYHDILPPEVKNKSRVRFVQGLFQDVLSSGIIIDQPDIILCAHMNKDHGFNKTNITLLAKTTKKGFLVTWGDNADMEDAEWFIEQFQLIYTGNNDEKAWKVNS